MRFTTSVVSGWSHQTSDQSQATPAGPLKRLEPCQLRYGAADANHLLTHGLGQGVIRRTGGTLRKTCSTHVPTRLGTGQHGLGTIRAPVSARTWGFKSSLAHPPVLTWTFVLGRRSVTPDRL
jgi:hypothetical protein